MIDQGLFVEVDGFLQRQNFSILRYFYTNITRMSHTRLAGYCVPWTRTWVTINFTRDLSFMIRVVLIVGIVRCRLSKFHVLSLEENQFIILLLFLNTYLINRTSTFKNTGRVRWLSTIHIFWGLRSQPDSEGRGICRHGRHGRWISRMNGEIFFVLRKIEGTTTNVILDFLL